MYEDKNTDDGNKNNLCLFVTLWTQGCPNKTVSSLPPKPIPLTPNTQAFISEASTYDFFVQY